MIPAIGIMIGLYITTRMLSLIAHRDREHPAVMLFAVLTILGTVYAIASIIIAGNEAAAISTQLDSLFRR